MTLGFQAAVAVVWVLSVARVTRLINSDAVLDPIRLWVLRHGRNAGAAATESEAAGREAEAVFLRRREGRWNTLAYFIGCPWCVSVWVAGLSAWIPLWHYSNPVAVYAGVVLAASHVVGLGSRLDPDGEIEVVGG